MYVLVRFTGPEGATGDICRQTVETVEHCHEIGLAEQACLVQHTCMRLRRTHVVRSEDPVEVSRLAQRRHGSGRSGLEPPAPQRTFVGAVFLSVSVTASVMAQSPRSRFAATFDDRPWISTKPFDADWSKLSPSSYVARLKS